MADSQDCTLGIIACKVLDGVDILKNIAQNLEPFERLLTGGAYVIGIAFAFKAIYTLKVYGEARTMMSSNASLKEPIVYLLVSAIFIYFPTALAVLLQTSFGDSNVLEYAPINSKNDTINAFFGSGSPVARPLTMIIQVIGLVAFIRGWILIARSAGQGQPPGGTGKGLVHVFGGILAINIVATIQVINNTLYGAG